MLWNLYLENKQHFEVEASSDEIRNLFRMRKQNMAVETTLADGRHLIVDACSIVYAVSSEEGDE